MSKNLNHKYLSMKLLIKNIKEYKKEIKNQSDKMTQISRMIQNKLGYKMMIILILMIINMKMIDIERLQQ